MTKSKPTESTPLDAFEPRSRGISRESQRVTQSFIRLSLCFRSLVLAAVVLLIFHPDQIFAMDPPAWVDEWATRGWSIAFAPDNTVLIAEPHSDRIERYSTTGLLIESWGSEGTGPGQFVNPLAIAVAPNGDVFVSDLDLNRIQRFSPGGDFLLQWGVSGTEPGQFRGPKSLVATQEMIFVCDVGNNRVQQFTLSGDYVNAIGSGVLVAPFGVGILPSGDLVVCDHDDKVAVFSQSGTFIRSWGGGGIDLGRFDGPIALAIDANSLVYVADRLNHRIQVFTETGTLLTSWGRLGALSGEFAFPTDRRRAECC